MKDNFVIVSDSLEFFGAKTEKEAKALRAQVGGAIGRKIALGTIPHSAKLSGGKSVELLKGAPAGAVVVISNGEYLASKSFTDIKQGIASGDIKVPKDYTAYSFGEFLKLDAMKAGKDLVGGITPSVDVQDLETIEPVKKRGRKPREEATEDEQPQEVE